jgi:hypothetical protein
MLAVIRSVSKRQLASTAKVSTRTIPTTLVAANEMPDTKLRRLFEAAASLTNEKQKTRDQDEAMLRWLAHQIGERGVKAMAEQLDYDEANLTKVVAGKRRIPGELRKRINE